jgi:transmembrane sensor
MSTPRPAAAGDGAPVPPALVTPEIAAEAAVWVTRLHGPDRSRQMERECLAWQELSAAHREAFERCTDTWQDVPRVSLASAFAASEQARPAPSPLRSGAVRWVAALGFVAAVMLGVLGYGHWGDRSVFATGVGEQQLVVLDDGTRMSLNTGTRVRVDLGATQRTVTIQEGEALFEVGKDSHRPFVVRVGGSEVVAIGTVFAVRFTSQGQGAEALAVTLIEGLVTVRPADRAGGLAPERTVRMLAGERVRLSGVEGAATKQVEPRVDRPNLQQLVAWKRNEAVFDDASLVDAVQEMNRYSRTPIVLLDDAGRENLRISGIYRTGDAAGFASAVAALHGLRLEQRDGRLELTGRH